MSGAQAEIDRVQALGGAVAAVESGYMKSQLVSAHSERRRRIEAGDDVVVGVNRFTSTEPNPLTADLETVIQSVDPATEAAAVTAVRAWRAQRDQQGAESALAALRDAATQSQRTAALAGFQRGSYRILVATDVASRGIHVQDIAHVINYDMPADAESFIHRAGRTGRAGEHGVASTLFARDQHSDLLQLERTLGVRMERMRESTDSWEKPDGAPARTPASPRHGSEGFSTRRGLDRTESAPRPRLERLPGEVFQFQAEG